MQSTVYKKFEVNTVIKGNTSQFLFKMSYYWIWNFYNFLNFIQVVKCYVIVSEENRTEITDIIIFFIFFVTFTAFTLISTLIFIHSWNQKRYINLI